MGFIDWHLTRGPSEGMGSLPRMARRPDALFWSLLFLLSLFPGPSLMQPPPALHHLDPLGSVLVLSLSQEDQVWGGDPPPQRPLPATNTEHF